jgi:hypothetical protein
MNGSLKDGVIAGVIAGIIWGWVSMGVNAVSGVFPYEGSFAHNLATFTAGGAVFGVVVGGLVASVGRLLPFRGALQRAVFISTALWLVLRGAGMMLSAMQPDRYHLLSPEFIQGVALAAAMGVILGLILRKGFNAA